jgi:hypothetical protein
VSSVSADGAASPAAAATAAEATAQERAPDGTDHPGAASAVAVATQLVRPSLLAEFSGTLNRLTGKLVRLLGLAPMSAR